MDEITHFQWLGMAGMVLSVLLAIYIYTHAFSRKRKDFDSDEFEFIESPKQLQVHIGIDETIREHEGGCLEEMADVVWNYHDMQQAVKKPSQSEEIVGNVAAMLDLEPDEISEDNVTSEDELNIVADELDQLTEDQTHI